MFHYIGQGINYAISIILWVVERIITRSGFFITGYALSEVLYKVTKQIFNEQLIGTSYCLPKEEWISWSILWEGLAFMFGLAIIVLITQWLGELLDGIMGRLRSKQDRELEFNNQEIGKMLFFLWVLFTITFVIINLINLYKVSILYVLITFLIDIFIGWFLFIFGSEPEPIILLFFLSFLPTGTGNSSGSGGTYVVFRIK